MQNVIETPFSYRLIETEIGNVFTVKANEQS